MLIKNDSIHMNISTQDPLYAHLSNHLTKNIHEHHSLSLNVDNSKDIMCSTNSHELQKLHNELYKKNNILIN